MIPSYELLLFDDKTILQVIKQSQRERQPIQQDRPRRRRKQDSGINPERERQSSSEQKQSRTETKERKTNRRQNKGSRKEDFPRFLRGKNGEFQHFRVSKSARPGTPVGRPRVTGLSKNGALVNWEMRHRYRRGGKFILSESKFVGNYKNRFQLLNFLLLIFYFLFSVPFDIHARSGLISIVKVMGANTLDVYTVKVGR